MLGARAVCIPDQVQACKLACILRLQADYLVRDAKYCGLSLTVNFERLKQFSKARDTPTAPTRSSACLPFFPSFLLAGHDEFPVHMMPVPN